MKKSSKRWLGAVAVTAGAIGAIGALLMKNSRRPSRRERRRELAQFSNKWARPGMQVVFRAELMPGRDASERTFRVKDLLPSGRVLLDGVAGEHAEKEFEPVRAARSY